MRVLLSAYACEPGEGSEPEVGWHAAMTVARHHDVWVLTRANNRPAIERELARTPVPRLRVVFYDLPAWARRLKRGGRGVQPYSYAWQAGAYLTARELVRRVGFDVAHHVTFGKYWAPSLLALLAVPFVWGPLGGGESLPRTFRRDLGLRGGAYEALRAAGRWVGEHDPWVRLTARRSAVALAKTEATAARLRALGARDVRVVSEAALAASEVEALAALPAPAVHRTRFLIVSRLLGWKGVHLALRAYAGAGVPASDCWVVGDGPARTALEAQARGLGIADRVRFLGRLRHEAMWRALGEAHVLVHATLHDSGGDICLEAMAAGRPVICLDLGGPGMQVTDDTGVKVAARTPDQAVREMARAMRRLADAPAVRDRMGAAGRRRVREDYRWDARGTQFAALYRAVARGNAGPAALHAAGSGEPAS